MFLTLYAICITPFPVQLGQGVVVGGLLNRGAYLKHETLDGVGLLER
mgnify:CR=1 FL=1